MECNFQGFIHSNFHCIRIALPNIPAEENVILGNRRRGATDGPIAFGSFGTAALIAAAAMGLMGGIATAAYLDLMISILPRWLARHDAYDIRCPQRDRVSIWDVFGTILYQKYGGFTFRVVAITVVYALIIPTLLLIPRNLIVTADGQKLQVAGQAED